MSDDTTKQDPIHYVSPLENNEVFIKGQIVTFARSLAGELTYYGVYDKDTLKELNHLLDRLDEIRTND